MNGIATSPGVDAGGNGGETTEAVSTAFSNNGFSRFYRSMPPCPHAGMADGAAWLKPLCEKPVETGSYRPSDPHPGVNAGASSPSGKPAEAGCGNRASQT